MTSVPGQTHWLRRTGGLWRRLVGMAAVFFLISGCTRPVQEELPVYEYQKEEGVLVVEGARYLEEQALMGALGNEGRWVFTGELGDAIGTCGAAEDRGGQFTVYEVVGDEGRDLLCALPSDFTFGPSLRFLGFREGITLGLPTPETVSRVVVTVHGDGGKTLELGETGEEGLIQALLALYDSQVEEAPLQGEGYEVRALGLYHSEYPALYFYLRGAYHAPSGGAYLKCADGNYRRLPQGFEQLMAAG